MFFYPTCVKHHTLALSPYEAIHNRRLTIRPLTCVRAQVSFEGGVAGEGALAVAADVAVHARVDLHVLLQGLLGLEAFCTQ